MNHRRNQQFKKVSKPTHAQILQKMSRCHDSHATQRGIVQTPPSTAVLTTHLAPKNNLTFPSVGHHIKQSQKHSVGNATTRKDCNGTASNQLSHMLCRNTEDCTQRPCFLVAFLARADGHLQKQHSERTLQTVKSLRRTRHSHHGLGNDWILKENKDLAATQHDDVSKC